MSNDGQGENTVLNWRGPLLAAGIFASVFALLLLMAYQNQSKTSDMGSSLREDPYGTSLLFDSFGRAGYQVKRSQDEDSLPDENAQRTTAFFIGGGPFGGWKYEKGKLRMGEKLRGRIEEFLSHGGRAVLVGPPGKLESASQHWELDIQWNEKYHEAKPAWITPAAEVLPADSEKMYLANDAPWLKTDAGWTVLYAGPDTTKSDSAPRVYMAMRKVGNGELLVASQEAFLLNEAIKARPNPVLLDFLAGGRPVVWIDETLHGLHQDQGVLWLVQRYRLQSALLFFWATLLTLLWSMSGDLVRRPARDTAVEVMRNGESAGVAGTRLLQRSITSQQVVAECWEQFRRRSPQDAQAISTAPAFGTRLREALTQPPLAGYKQLSQLIAERRAVARGLAGRSERQRSEDPKAL